MAEEKNEITPEVEEKTATPKPRKKKAKVVENPIEQVENMEQMTPPIHEENEALDETIYAPMTVTKKVMNESGVYEEVKVELKRKKTEITVGLDADEVSSREAAKWVNVNDKKGTRTVGTIIFTNLFTIFNILCFGIAAWLISVGAYTKCFFVFIVTANIVIGIIQEVRAKKVIDKLSILSAPTVFVLREGEEREIEVKSIVIDDIMLLSNGKQICSDSIVVEGTVEVNESLLTGESDPILKKPGDLLYSGSFIVSGICKARVEKVGEENYIQKLTKQAKKYEKPKSNIMASLKIIIRTVGVLIFILGPVYFLMACGGTMFGWHGFFGGTLSYYDAVTTTAGAIIGMIPSGLFLLTSIALATSVVRLSHNKTLVQELYCIEMLARVNVLCLDKTGTITDGTMTVRGLIEYKNETGFTTKQLISAVLNAQNDDNLTSKALVQKFGLGKKIKVNAIIPFSSSRKYSATEFDKIGTIMMGAPEFILKKNFELVEEDVLRNAKLGYRVLLIAKSGKIEGTEIKGGEPTPIALVLIEDTIRPDAIETIKYFKEAGVNVRVISGDNPATVAKVSERAGIDGADKYISLDGLSDKEVIKAADKYNVFGRVTPNQKKLLVKTLKSQGNTVAMTGDGVNDILALKEADCSIAMASGSEAARNVSHLVLMDSNFSSLPKVVYEGRRVINNIQRVSSLFLTKTIFSTLLLMLVVCLPFMKTYPLDPSQLYMIDFLVVGIPSFFLALETNKNRIQGNFLKNVLRNALPGALVIVGFALIVYWIVGWQEASIMANMTKVVLNGSPVTIADVRTTIIVVSTTFSCLLVLFRICKPFNYLRGILWTCMLGASIILTVSIPGFFGIIPFWKLDIISLLVLVILLISAYPLMGILSDGKNWFKERAKRLAEWLGRIDE